VDGIGVPVALEADRKRLFLVGYGRWPLQALSGHDGRTLWESRRGPDLLTLTWLDVALQRRIVYVTGSERALDRPGQVALEARRARDGRLLWSVREPITAAGGGGWDEGRLVAVDGSRLFVAGARTSETGTELGFVSSRRTADGEELWRRESTDYNRLQTMAVAGDRLLLLQSIVGGPGRARVTAVDASSGSQLWSVERGTDLPVRYEPRSAAVSGQVLVVAIDVDGGQGPGQPNDLLFLGLRITDGTELWSDRIRGSYPTGSAGVAAQGTAVVGGGLLFAGGGSGERIFRGYGRATGGRHWELRETPFFAGVLSIAGGRLLAAGSSLGSPRDAIVRVYALPPD
jgi:outer membrane protein assembly factor BamB